VIITSIVFMGSAMAWKHAISVSSRMGVRCSISKNHNIY
jgi:hypothetical protein